jgi:hypothetical protein
MWICPKCATHFKREPYVCPHCGDDAPLPREISEIDPTSPLPETLQRAKKQLVSSKPVRRGRLRKPLYQTFFGFPFWLGFIGTLVLLFGCVIFIIPTYKQLFLFPAVAFVIGALLALMFHVGDTIRDYFESGGSTRKEDYFRPGCSSDPESGALSSPDITGSSSAPDVSETNPQTIQSKDNVP